MTLHALSILILFALFSTTLTCTSTSEPSPFSANQLNLCNKNPISFSTQVFSRRRYSNRQPSSTSTSSPSKVKLDVHPYPNKALVMVVGIGKNSTSTPILTTELLVDTGSSLTWLQAVPCDSCYEQGDFPYYNHSASESFHVVNCQDEICNVAPKEVDPDCSEASGSLEEPCVYHIRYVDQSSSRGIIGTETFYFLDNVHVEFVPFGLGTSNFIPSEFKGFAPGMAGLTRGSGTLLNRLGVKKFSHCFPREEDDTGILSFGEEAKIIGDKLVLNNESEGYEALLTNVYVAGEHIPVGDGVLPEVTVFDTGTIWAYLSPQVMDAIVASIKIALRKFKPRRWGGIELCYNTYEMLSINLDEIAKITFEFGYATKIDLFSFNVWIRLKQQGLFCLGFIRGSPGSNVFGNILMREMNIGYTLDEDDLAMYINHQHCWK